MADAATSTNLKDQAASTSPALAQTLPSDAVLDALKMILLGAPLNEVLKTITRLIEAHSTGMLCSIFLLDEDGLHLRYGVAASLPEAYRAATDGCCIGPNAGSCGSAAYLRDRSQTALTRAFEQIEKSEAQLRQIVDTIPQTIAVLNPDGTPLYVNQTMLDYTGLTIEEVMATDFRVVVFHPEDVTRFRNESVSSFSRDVPFENEKRILCKDGQYRWFLMHFNPLRDEQRRVIRWYATAIDIDDRVRAEERTRNENLALREQTIVTRCLRT